MADVSDPDLRVLPGLDSPAGRGNAVSVQFFIDQIYDFASFRPLPAPVRLASV